MAQIFLKSSREPLEVEFSLARKIKQRWQGDPNAKPAPVAKAAPSDKVDLGAESFEYGDVKRISLADTNRSGHAAEAPLSDDERRKVDSAVAEFNARGDLHHDPIDRKKQFFAHVGAASVWPVLWADNSAHLDWAIRPQEFTFWSRITAQRWAEKGAPGISLVGLAKTSPFTPSKTKNVSETQG